VATPTAEKDKLTRGALFLVMGASLTLGTWSIYTLLTARFHAPIPVALFGAIMFDAAALFFARLAQTYATSPDSGLVPRLAMLAMICTSSWVNWQHAKLEHWGRVGSVILAGAPIVSELAFELYHRYVHREALRAQGRVASALPVLGKWAWILHPTKAFRVVDRTVAARLDAVSDDALRLTLDREAPHSIDALHQAGAPLELVAVPDYLLRALAAASSAPPALEAAPPASDAPAEAPAQPGDALVKAAAPQPPATPVQRITPAASKRGAAPPALHLAGLTKAAAVRAVRDAHPTASTTQIALHLEEHGITAEPNYIRTVLSRDTKPKGQTPGNGGYL
jgi:hypothetical protein